MKTKKGILVVLLASLVLVLCNPGIGGADQHSLNRVEAQSSNGLFTEIKKLLASDGAGSDSFGRSVSLSGDTAVVGALWDDDNGPESGSAYIFYRHAGGTDNWGQVKKITASDGGQGDAFGTSVAISGDALVVGAAGANNNGVIAGAAYIFYRYMGGTDNWGQVKKITASDGAAGDDFGASVTISGDALVVGAAEDDDNGSGSGSAYIFHRDQDGLDNWGQVTKIKPFDGASRDGFGHSVDIDGDTLVVGACYDDAPDTNSGSVYIFYRDHGGLDNWGQVEKITPSDGAAMDYFGYSVSISGDTAAIAAHLDDDNGYASGSVYIFYRDQDGLDNWGQIEKITASDGAAWDRFGNPVSLYGNTLVVGADGDDDNGLDSGSAYIFLRDEGGQDNWGETDKITAGDGAASDSFGSSVAINGNTVVVGADLEDNASGTNAGSAYVFTRENEACDGDFDTDGDLDGVDLETFASAFVVYDPAADFNNDTSIDDADMQVFTENFGMAVCP